MPHRITKPAKQEFSCPAGFHNSIVLHCSLLQNGSAASILRRTFRRNLRAFALCADGRHSQAAPGSGHERHAPGISGGGSQRVLLPHPRRDLDSGAEMRYSTPGTRTTNSPSPKSAAAGNCPRRHSFHGIEAYNLFTQVVSSSPKSSSPKGFRSPVSKKPSLLCSALDAVLLFSI